MPAGRPIAWNVLAEGTPVRSSDGQEIGTVDRVLADEEKDIFEGLILATPGGRRHVAADAVVSIHEDAVTLGLNRDEARGLAEPTENPAVLAATPDDTVPDTAGDRAQSLLRRAWNRLSGNY
jgi:hypothetical protein